jgi:hypothetical protein
MLTEQPRNASTRRDRMAPDTNVYVDIYAIMMAMTEVDVSY